MLTKIGNLVKNFIDKECLLLKILVKQEVVDRLKVMKVMID